MRRATLFAVIAAMAVSFVAVGQPTASADAPRSAPQPLGLTNWRQVNSGFYDAPAGQQSYGDVTCPAGTKVVGGGAGWHVGGPAENLNGSVPLSDKRTWRVYLNNTSDTDDSFVVYANCVSQAVNYSVVSGTPVNNPAGAQVIATVTCPTGTVPLGGGGVSGATTPNVNINSTIPLSDGWRIDNNNNSKSDTPVTAYAVCAKKPQGYEQLTSTARTVEPGTQAFAQAECPSTKFVLGGGGYSSSSSLRVNLTASIGVSDDIWRIEQNNNSTKADTATATAVCAKVN